MSETENDPFDWGPLGEAWWLETASQLGASPLQTKFACAKHRGCTNTEAARQAGYQADADGMRSAGYRAMRSNVTERLLAFAAGEDGGYGGEVDRDEARRILSSLARGSDPRVRISAVEQLNKMDAADRDVSAEPVLDPKEAFKALAEASPAAAIAAAIESGMHPEDMGALQKGAEKYQEEIALSWIQRSRPNAARAKEMAEWCLRQSNTTSGA